MVESWTAIKSKIVEIHSPRLASLLDNMKSFAVIALATVGLMFDVAVAFAPNKASLRTSTKANMHGKINDKQKQCHHEQR